MKNNLNFYIREYIQMVYTLEQGRVQRNLNRAKKKSNPATLTVLEWFRILHLYKFSCAFCKGRYDTMEHLVRLCRGGGTTAGNCVPACSECNSKRGVVYQQTEQMQRRLAENLIGQ